MKTKTLVSIFFICGFIACSKSAENTIFIRVQNNTAQDFKEVITNKKSFLNITASDSTSYMSFSKANAAYITLIDNNNDTALAGSIPIEGSIPALSQGHYTLIIFTDSSAYFGYNCQYIKE